MLTDHVPLNEWFLPRQPIRINQMMFSTEKFVCRETGWYLTGVQMDWLIAQTRQESFTSRAVTDRGDHPDIGPWACDG